MLDVARLRMAADRLGLVGQADRHLGAVLPAADEVIGLLIAGRQLHQLILAAAERPIEPRLVLLENVRIRRQDAVRALSVDDRGQVLGHVGRVLRRQQHDAIVLADLAREPVDLVAESVALQQLVELVEHDQRGRAIAQPLVAQSVEDRRDDQRQHRGRADRPDLDADHPRAAVGFDNAVENLAPRAPGERANASRTSIDAPIRLTKADIVRSSTGEAATSRIAWVSAWSVSWVRVMP